MFIQEFHRFLCGYEDSIVPQQLQPPAGQASDELQDTFFEKVTLWFASIL